MRTLEEVQATLHIAKLKEDDLHPLTHCLSFSDNVSSGDYCLMELDDTLCKHIEAGKRCSTFSPSSRVMRIYTKTNLH